VIELVELPPGAEFAAGAADVFEAELARVLADRDVVHLALSGGSTPWPVLAELAERSLDWSRVHVWQVDERIAPAGDEARNLSGLTAALADRVAVALHAMPVGAGDPARGAAAYAAALPERLDVVHLGLGDDGHTASLVPGDPVLEVTDRAVAVTGPYQGHRRMTLTYPVLAGAGSILWLVSGSGKAAMAARLLAGDRTIPAGRVDAERALLLTDAPLVTPAR
jgi:6-phosphogluconolactonase